MKNKQLKFYLAHQLKHRHKVREIELKLENDYNIILANPFYDSMRKDVQKLDAGEIKNRTQFTKKQCNDIVNNDLEMIDNNDDGILAILFDIEALGTYMEIMYCSRVLHRNVYLISPEKKIRNHVWCRVHCKKRFKSINDFEKWLNKNGYKKD